MLCFHCSFPYTNMILCVLPCFPIVLFFHIELLKMKHCNACEKRFGLYVLIFMLQIVFVIVIVVTLFLWCCVNVCPVFID